MREPVHQPPSAVSRGFQITPYMFSRSSGGNRVSDSIIPRGKVSGFRKVRLLYNTFSSGQFMNEGKKTLPTSHSDSLEFFRFVRLVKSLAGLDHLAVSDEQEFL